MDFKSVKDDILRLLCTIKETYPTKTPFIFGKGFKTHGFITCEYDDEMVVPSRMCINSSVLDVLSDPKTMFHIYNFMRISSKPPTIEANEVRAISAALLMLSCVQYSFNNESFPYCSNGAIHQLWADMEYMSKGTHVSCTIVKLAMRGRSHAGFEKQHAVRSKMAPVVVPCIPAERQPPPPPRPKYSKVVGELATLEEG